MACTLQTHLLTSSLISPSSLAYFFIRFPTYAFLSNVDKVGLFPIVKKYHERKFLKGTPYNGEFSYTFNHLHSVLKTHTPTIMFPAGRPNKFPQ